MDKSVKDIRSVNWATVYEAFEKKLLFSFRYHEDMNPACRAGFRIFRATVGQLEITGFKLP